MVIQNSGATFAKSRKVEKKKLLGSKAAKAEIARITKYTLVTTTTSTTTQAITPLYHDYEIFRTNVKKSSHLVLSQPHTVVKDKFTEPKCAQA